MVLKFDCPHCSIKDCDDCHHPEYSGHCDNRHGTVKFDVVNDDDRGWDILVVDSCECELCGTKFRLNITEY